MPSSPLVPTIAEGRLRKDVERGPLKEFLAFKLGDEIFAIPIQHVGAILKIPPITRVPRAPEEVMGIVSVRGKVVAVLDLRRRFQLPQVPLTPASRILLLPGEGRDPVGLVIDAVLQVYRLAEHEIESAGHALGTDVGEHVLGVGRSRGIILVLVDIEPILKKL